MKHRIVSMLLIVLTLFIMILPATAQEGIVPRYNNTGTTTTSFGITAAGKATIAGNYYAYSEYFQSATITAYLEKRTLGLFWSKVDIDMPDNEWVYTSTEPVDAFAFDHYLDKTGTYRATVVYEISGTGGATDVIEYEQERTYS